MSDCSNHKKDLFGQTDMKVVAEAIGDLHYETLSYLLQMIAVKFQQDGLKDLMGKREKLCYELLEASAGLVQSSIHIDEAYKISKPFMK